MSYDFKLKTIGIYESENLFFEARSLELRRDAELPQAVLPVPQRGLGNAERGRAHCAYARAASSNERPGKKRENGARMAHLISEIEVICARIVKIDGPLYQPQAEKFSVEIQSSLSVG
jgi:hypothetical protein